MMAAAVGVGAELLLNPGKAPGRSTVPKIFHGGIVVQRDSIHEVLFEELRGIGIPDVGVVPGEMVVLAVISHLHKAADML